MNLSKEDLLAIGELIDAKNKILAAEFDGKLDVKTEETQAYVHKLFKLVIQAHVQIFEKMEELDTHIKLIITS